MKSLVEPERIHAGRALRFATRASRAAPRLQKYDRPSRPDSGGGLTAPGGSGFPRTRVISRRSRQRLALGDLA